MTIYRYNAIDTFVDEVLEDGRKTYLQVPVYKDRKGNLWIREDAYDPTSKALPYQPKGHVGLVS